MSKNYTKCGCADGLECKVTKSFEYLGKVYKFKQCKAVDVPVIPEELKADSPRQKRFLIRVGPKLSLKPRACL